VTKRSTEITENQLIKKYQDVTIPILERVSLRNIQLKVTHSGSGRTVDIALQQFIIDSMGEKLGGNC
jgi:hypothetical protein